MPSVRLATASDLVPLGRTLARAFADDPVWTHVAKPGPLWVDRAARWFTAEAAIQVSGHGHVLVDDDLRGAALWSPPEQWKASLLDTARIAPASIALFRSRVLRALGVQTRLEKLHPVDPPHWYLYLLGTDPTHQGRGVGSALLTAVTERCDVEGIPAYLESSKETNLAFYARHGFVVVEEIVMPKGPHMWRMWREPKG